MNIIRTVTRKARKEHKCDFCDGIILIAEKYKCQTNVYDRQIYEWKSHLRCNEIVLKLNMYNEFDEGLSRESFREYITEEYYRISDEDKLCIDFNTRLNTVCDHHLTITNKL